jgi:hypothetical protein
MGRNDVSPSLNKFEPITRQSPNKKGRPLLACLEKDLNLLFRFGFGSFSRFLGFWSAFSFCRD